jgi:hypothetical protein
MVEPPLDKGLAEEGGAGDAPVDPALLPLRSTTGATLE